MVDLEQKRKRRIVSLRFSILSIFFSLFAIAMLSIIAINYFNSAKIMLAAANKLMHEVSTSLQREFTSEIDNAAHDSALSAQLIEHGLLDVERVSETVNYTYDLAYRFNIVQSAYWGDSRGTYVKTEYEPNDSLTSDIVDRSGATPTRTLLYRDLKGNIIKRVQSFDLRFDPRHRPWYQQAATAKKTVWTDIYVYEPNHYLGITIAAPVYYHDGKLQGVFGLDIRLDWLSWYMGQRKVSPNGVTFIVNKTGNLIAFPNLEALQKPVTPSKQEPLLVDIHTLKVPGVARSFDLYKQHQKSEFSFKYHGQTFLAVYNLIPSFSMHGWLIAVVVPRDDFVGDLKKSSLLDALIGLIILLIGIALVSTLITRIVKPMKRAVKQIDKLKNFDLSQQKPIYSRIEEVISLTESVQAVRAGLKSFRRYVPASLVRKLIKAGEDAKIGGAKRPLTIFFSDIENFTALSEKLDPNSLMELICDYFDALSKVVLREKGTIDKYIGDSLMAFWGAPLPVRKPEVKAAKAALLSLQRLDVLNKEWKKAGKHPFVTRIGLHTGEAIVGNVGSTKRLNYTALGDVINVAKRLEEVNKIYGTKILVSSAMYECIKQHFVLRKVDHVIVKGKLSGSMIYELLALRKKDLSFDISAYQEEFDVAYMNYQDQQWDKAIARFEKCLKIYPKDKLAWVFIHRCNKYKSHPPVYWDGIWRVVE